MTVKIIRCAIYTRKSSEEGLEQNFNSLHAQREACEAYITSQKHEGWQLIKTHYDDGGFSGGNMNRPALLQLMKDIEAGKIDVIVVYKVDRLSRSLHDFAKMVEVFDRHNVSFVSVTQQFNTTTSMGRLTLNVLLSFAQFEREVTGERIRDKIAASKAKGMWMGGTVPLGYDVKDRMLVINPAEAERVQYIYKRYLELGSVRALREKMQQKGITGKVRNSEARPGGAIHSRGALYRILSSRLYIGQVDFKGKYYDGQHDGIIDPELWNQVQKSLSDNKPGPVKDYRRVEARLLNKKLFDGVTGEPLLAVHATKNGRRYRYYISNSLHKGTVEGGATGWRLPGQVIESAVYGIIRTMLQDEDRIVSAMTAANVSLQYIPEILAKAQLVGLHQDGALDEFSRKVVVMREAIQVEISLAPLLPESVKQDDISVTHSKPMQMQRRGNELRLIVQGTGSSSKVDDKLLTSIARAHKWAEEILSGSVASMKDIAIRENVSDSYVKKVMPLAFLAPDIVTAILAGKQPAQLTKKVMIRQVQMPQDWYEQHKFLGFSSKALAKKIMECWRHLPENAPTLERSCFPR